MDCFLLIFMFSVSTGTVLCEEFGETDGTSDIPIIEGDGGTITTVVEDDVLVLTQENFDVQISSRKIVLVEFYAPWCGHCQSLAPEYAHAAKLLKKAVPPITLAKVDATVETDLAAKYEVDGYPKLFVFKNGTKYPYDGPRTALGIVEHMKQLSDPSWKPPPDAVVILTNENFTEIINNANLILVEFYAPWCGYCKRLAPEYERAAKVLKALPVPIPLAKVDATVEKSLAEEYEATGYPTLYVFRKGKRFPYEGPREEAGIIAYMKLQAKPASEEVHSLKALRNSISQTTVTVVGFFHSNTVPLYEKYMESGEMLRSKFRFFHTFDSQVAKHFGITDGNKVVLFQPERFSSEYEPQIYEFTDVNGTAEDITAFLKDNFIPLVGERSKAHAWIYQNRYPLIVVYYDVNFSFEHRVQTQLIRKEIAKVAKDFAGKIVFAISNEEDYQEELVDLKLDDSGEDVNVAFFASEKVRYRMDPVEDFSADELREFAVNVLAGKIPRYVKTQPAPKENKGPVITVVGSTFEQLVTNADRDVLIEFYAPWCGHCKKLEPIYKKLAKKFAGDDRILICKMDATANDAPEQFPDIRGFPTIYYIPLSDKNNYIRYDGDRSLDDLMKFVNKQLKKDHSKDEL